MHYETVKEIIKALCHHAVELLCVSLNSGSGFRVTSLQARHYRAFPECQACTHSLLMRQDKGYFSYFEQRRANCLFWEDACLLREDDFILDEQNSPITAFNNFAIYRTTWWFISGAIRKKKIMKMSFILEFWYKFILRLFKKKKTIQKQVAYTLLIKV